MEIDRILDHLASGPTTVEEELGEGTSQNWLFKEKPPLPGK